jgi:mannosyltransferase
MRRSWFACRRFAGISSLEASAARVSGDRPVLAQISRRRTTNPVGGNVRRSSRFQKLVGIVLRPLGRGSPPHAQTEAPGVGTTSVWLLVFVLLLAFALRLFYLTDKEIWYDEAFAALYAGRDLGSIVYGTITPVQGAAADIHPLLYYFFLHGWMQIGQSPFVLRFPSVAFGMLAVALVARLGARLFQPKVGLLAAALTAVSPFHIWYSQEARMYSLLCLVSLVSIYFFVKGWQEDRWLNWGAFGFFTGLSLYVHNLAFLIPLSLGLVVAARRRWRLLAHFWMASTMAVAIFLPWLVLVPGQLAKVRQAYWVPTPGPAELVRTLIVFAFNLPVPSWLLPVSLFYSVLVLALALFLTFSPQRNGKKATSLPGWLPLALALLPPVLMFLISQVRAVYIERALLVSALLYYVGLSQVALTHKMPRLVIATLIPVPALLAGSLWHQYHYSEFPRSPFHEVNAYLGEHVQAGDVIVHDNKLSFFPSYYYDPTLRQEYIGDIPGSSTDTLALPTQQALGLLAQVDVQHAVDDSRRVWFVVFQRALDEALELGAENPSKAWLDAHYRLADTVVYRDLRVCLYERP